jgi:anti-sigma factor RsiW
VRCTDAQTLIESYVDGELDVAHTVEIEQHLGDCSICAPRHQDVIELSSRIREEVPYFRASPDLQQRIRAIAREKRAETSRSLVPLWAWSGATAAVVLFAVITVGLGRRASESSREQMITQEIVADHLRSLMANHLTDITSTDQHNVEPWFNGKLDFAPPVNDFAAEGFPLMGGRLDYLDGRPVAALVYQRRLHPINLFVWTAAEKYADKATQQTRQGYSILFWTRDGMTYCAISDLTVNEMQTLAALLQK